MTSRYTGTIRGSGLGARSYAGIGSYYAPLGDDEREPATEPSPREIIAPVHEQIARQHPALVAAFRAIPPGGRKPEALRAVGAWKREHHAGIQEAKSWPA